MEKKLISVLLAILLLLTCIPLGAVSVSAANYEYAMFPMTYLNISQGVNGSYSHLGTKAIDITGKDTGIDAAYAPFTGVVKRIYKKYVVWLESSSPVIYADGTVDYMTIMVMHDNDTSDLYVGKTIKQGAHFFDEGTTGNATGNHIHMECGKGRFQGNGWYQNTAGNWVIYNSIEPYKALHISSSTVVKNGYGYSWKTANHAHNYNTYIYYEAAHPHYKWYQCSCGAKQGNYSQPTYVNTCETCNPSATIATGTYVIKNNARQKFLNVAYGEDKNATNIHLHEFGNWYSQYYEITPSTTTGGYAIRPLCSKTRMINVYADTVVSGKNVCIWDNTGHDSQRWRFSKVSGGYVIRNVQAPNCVLDIQSDGNVYVATYTGAASQIWSIQNAIKYNANGGSNAPATQFKDYDSSIKLSAQKPTRAGYTFLGWAESASAKTAKYAAGATYSARENVNLYAVWAKPTYANILSVPSTARYANKGAKVTVPIKAEGDGLTYTWYIKNEGQTKYSKSSVTSATYATKMSSKSKNRRAYCIIKDKYGNSERSKTFILRESVSVITQPKSVTVKKNATAKATVKASGDGLRYQWYVKNAGQSKYSKSSITTATYSAKMTSKSNGRRLICCVYDKYGNKVQSKTVVIKMK